MKTLQLAARWLAALFAMTLVFGIVGCDDDDDEGGPTFDYYVDGAVGVDDGPGSRDMPFASITQALSVAEPGQDILVGPGLYDAAHGETFPLRVPEGVELVGDPGNKGEGTVIQGGGASPVVSFSTDPSVTLVLEGATTLAGFTVLNDAPGNRIGVQVDGESVTLRQNTVRDIQPGAGAVVGVAIVTTEGSGHAILDNDVVGNDRGIALFRGGDRTVLEGNRVVGNGDGVTTANMPYGYDFGGGNLGSKGGNVFSCNEDHDVAVWYGNVVDMKNNAWDHAPPTVGVQGDIRSFTREGEPDAVFDASGAVEVAEPCS
jgi:parallel beta-helix repeat protein